MGAVGGGDELVEFGLAELGGELGEEEHRGVADPPVLVDREIGRDLLDALLKGGEGEGVRWERGCGGGVWQSKLFLFFPVVIRLF